ncbi:hypothetical protein [Magnetospirillum moscoviense]|uniref:Uncharacterized protein n=1 Tax=Magnetospirillum moscoviense TaxID=1437059 RepID=A0A178MMY4_9PROT|nr:hypothetical protein [Magnetospirillum moscoviense]MBF0324331.1 hypothetical protein [Alphaproteobacteria bacterium]OAN49903.1 hypothetical protein A6A05_12825 [Magnetospirillum moscoviense]
MSDGPTPEQQAEYLVRKMEQVIRDNRTVKGMSFRTWQAIAKEEIANAIRDAEKRHVDRDRTISRIALLGSGAMVSIGFWGAVVAVDRSYGGTAALVALAAGAMLLFFAAEWGLKRASTEWSKHKRAERLANIEALDLRIKRMEAALRKKEERLKEKMEEVGLL